MPTAMPDVCSVKSGGTVVVPFALPNTLSVAGKDVHGGVALLFLAPLRTRGCCPILVSTGASAQYAIEPAQAIGEAVGVAVAKNSRLRRR